MLRQAPHIHDASCSHGPYGRPRLPVTDCFGGGYGGGGYGRAYPAPPPYTSPWPYPPEPEVGGISIQEIANITTQIIAPLADMLSQKSRQERRAEQRAEREERVEIRAKLAGEALATAAQVGASAEILQGYVARYREAVERALVGDEEKDEDVRPVAGVVIEPGGQPRVAYGPPASAPRVPFQDQGFAGEPAAVRRGNARVYGAGGTGSAVVTPEPQTPPPLPPTS